LGAIVSDTGSDSPGPGVDARGAPVIDPTKNVLDLVELNVKRIDDMADLRDSHYREMADIRERHASEMIRAEALAAQVATSAETLRNQQAATVAQSDVTLGTALKPLQEAIAELRTIQYQQAGAKAATTESKTDTRAGVNIWLVVGGLLLTGMMAFLAMVSIAVAMYLGTRGP
jgi:hypothetical protein